MRRRSAIAVLLCLATTSALVVHADHVDIRKELKNIADMQLQAFKRKDVKGYLKYLAPNYSVTTVEGRTLSQTRPELEREILAEMEDTVSIDFVRRHIQELKVERDLVVVIVNQKSSRVLKEGDSQHKWEAGVLQRERWIKTDEGLKLSSIEALEVQYLIEDGKSISGSRNGVCVSCGFV